MSGECDICGEHTLECRCNWHEAGANPPNIGDKGKLYIRSRQIAIDVSVVTSPALGDEYLYWHFIIPTTQQSRFSRIMPDDLWKKDGGKKMLDEDYKRPESKRTYNTIINSPLEWINVNHKLPIHKQYVLVAGFYKLNVLGDSKEKVKYCIYDALESEFICQEAGHVEYIDATHWLPLPSPPEL